MGAVATHAINPYLFKKMPYDAEPRLHADHAGRRRPERPGGDAASGRRGKRSTRSRRSIALCPANPGKLNYGSGGNGSAGHLAGELFKSMAGISMVHIPYKGAAPAKLELMSGEIQLMFDNLASATPQIRSGAIEGAGGHDARPRDRPAPTCRPWPRAA